MGSGSSVVKASSTENGEHGIESEFLHILEDVELNTDKYEIKLKETYCNILNINLDNQNFGNKII